MLWYVAPRARSLSLSLSLSRSLILLFIVLRCAQRAVGGKVIVLASSLPTVGVGKLRNRQAECNAENESKMLAVADQWYQRYALEASRVQISVDLFMYTAKHADVATLGVLSRFTGGELFYYNLSGKDQLQGGKRLEEDLVTDLTRQTGFEAVLRVRCSKGTVARVCVLCG